MNDFKYLAVIDFEATCSKDNKINKSNQEIIEMGCVILDYEKLEVIKELQYFIKPILEPILTKFCKELTSIKQEDVDNAKYYHEVIKKMVVDILKLKILKYNQDGVLFCSWGDFDRKLLKRNCRFESVQYPFSNYHLNIKYAFSKTLNKKNKQCGMKKAMNIAGLPLDGSHHRALDDAKNITKILCKMIKEYPIVVNDCIRWYDDNERVF